jgi:hypothetical protein
VDRRRARPDDAKIDALYKQGLLQDLVAETTGLRSDISGLIAEFVGYGWRAERGARDEEEAPGAHRAARAVPSSRASPAPARRTSWKELLELWRELEPKANFVLCAFTHAAARLMGAGSTLAHVQNRPLLRPAPEHGHIIHEHPQVPLLDALRIGRGLNLGARFVLLGDFEGQFLPMSWLVQHRPVQETEDRQGSRAAASTWSSPENRRFTEDPAHFERFKGLYGHADASPETTREQWCWRCSGRTLEPPPPRGHPAWSCPTGSAAPSTTR